MLYLLKYFCQKLSEILMTETKSLCRFFNYSNVVTYLEKMEEYLTLEESASGDFITCINNTGETC